MTVCVTSQLDTLVESGEVGEYERACEVHLSRTCKQPSFHELVQHMERFGPDCVLESAYHLPASEYEALKRRVSNCQVERPRRRTRRR